MEIITKEFDSFIDKWHTKIWELEPLRCANDLFATLEEKRQLLQEFYVFEIEKTFPKVLLELRKNLVHIEGLVIVKNYKSYIQKSLNSLLKLLEERKNDNLDLPDMDQFNDNSEDPTIDRHVTYLVEVHYHFTWMYDDLLVIREELNKELDLEISLRKGNKLYEKILELPTNKFKWKGTPAQLAYIVNLLQEKGYIEGLTQHGERNAKLILSHFEVKDYNPTPESLGKCFQAMKKDELPINVDDAAKFLKFPHRNDLKR